MPASQRCISKISWSRQAFLVLAQCLFGAWASADIRVALIIPGYDSADQAELSDSLLENAFSLRREGILESVFGEPVDIDVADNGCDPHFIPSLFARWQEASRAPVVVLGDCGAATLSVAGAYALEGLTFVVPFAQETARTTPSMKGVIHIEPDGTAAAAALVSALRREERKLEGQGLVLAGESGFADAFYRQLVAEDFCEQACDLLSMPESADEMSRYLAAADWVIYAGTDVESLEEPIWTAPSGQRWVIYNRGSTPTREWLDLVNLGAYADVEVTLVVPPIPELEAPVKFASANGAYLFAALQVAARQAEAGLRTERSGGFFSGIGKILGGGLLGVRKDVKPRDAPGLATYSAEEYLENIVYSGDVVGAIANETASVSPVTEPSGNGDAEPPTVYNLSIAPLESNAPLALQPGVETALTFSLGPNLDSNVLGNAPVNPDIKELAAGQTLKLGVTLNCLVCAAGSYQRRTLEYDPQQGESLDPALFTIVPDAGRTDPVTGKGLLLFTVDAQGIDLDVIHVGVFVGAPTTEQAQGWTPPTVRRVRHGTILDEDAPDLVIDVAAAAGFLPVTIIPHSPELRAALEQELGASQDGAWSFESGVAKDDLDGLVRNAYVELRAMIEQHEALKAYFAGLGRDATLSSGAARLNLSDSDRRAMLDPLRTYGARIYDRVFMRGDQGLRDGIRLVEDFAAPGDRPLRIVFRVSNIYAPWQLLYPSKTGAVDVERFWGFRHEMGTRQLVDAAQATLLTRMGRPNAEQTLFAAYRSTVADDVAARAQLFAQNVNELLSEDLDVADSREEFLARLGGDGYKLRLIIAYGHATSGTVLEASSGGVPLMVGDAGSPRFAFAESEYLVPDDIDDYTPPPDDGLLLEGQPLVIFNACETGGGGLRPMNNNGFVGALTRAGARAVIVTETPVWNNFAYHFARDVFAGLMDGRSAGTALLDARRRHLFEWNNPLGLIYTLYGNPAARIE